MEELFQSLDRRYRPEKVASLIYPYIQLDIIKQVASTGHYYTSMSEDFSRPTGINITLKKASELFHVDEPDYVNLLTVEKFIREVENQIHIQPGKVSFKFDRLNKASRKASGIDLSRRQYNKLFRLAQRLERKRTKFAVESEKREFQQVSKSRFASKINFENFSSDIDSACFIAYYTSKCNLRSTFTNTAQDKPFDEICKVLLDRCKSHPTSANWWAIAYVYPDDFVLKHLSEAQKGELLGRWYDLLVRLANLLEKVWDNSKIDRRSMIVRKGNDSSTWNVMAGAWNKARSAWLSLVYSLGMESILDEVFPGKVLRLMAADVAYWHTLTGGKLEPDTAVWCEIPLPWKVLSGEDVCTKKILEEVCAKYKLDPVKKGWTSSLRSDIVHQFKPTPELVHGVNVYSPYLAKILRKEKYFSGKF